MNLVKMLKNWWPSLLKVLNHCNGVNHYGHNLTPCWPSELWLQCATLDLLRLTFSPSKPSLTPGRGERTRRDLTGGARWERPKLQALTLLEIDWLCLLWLKHGSVFWLEHCSTAFSLLIQVVSDLSLSMRAMHMQLARSLAVGPFLEASTDSTTGSFSS